MEHLADITTRIDGQEQPTAQLTEMSALVRFFADLVEYPQGTYLGVEFVIDATLGNGAQDREPLDGDRYVRVALPRPLNADALIESRPASHPGNGDALDTHFVWSAANGDYLRAVIRGPFLDALVALNEKHPWVMVTDHWAGFGDIHGPPAEQARYTDLLIRAIIAHTRAREQVAAEVTDWNGPPVELGRDAAEQPFFCFFCGATFACEVAVCAACGADLAEDE